MTRVRRGMYSLAVALDTLVGIFSILGGIILAGSGIIILPLAMLLIVFLPLVIALIIAGVITAIVGFIMVILAIFAYRGRKLAFVALTFISLFYFILSIVNLIWRFDESVENIWGLVAPLLYGILFLLHLAGLTVATPVFCRRYRPVCLARR